MPKEVLRGDLLREAGDRARELEKLQGQPAWERLQKEFELLKKLYIEQAGKKALSANAINQRDLDYRRGFLAGANWILNLPDMAISTLEAVLEKERVK